MTAPTAAPLPKRLLDVIESAGWHLAPHEIYAIREAAAALAQLPPTPADAIAIADAIRLRYARDYDEKRPDWQGKVYWAKVEAAAHIIRVLRHAAPTGIPQASVDPMMPIAPEPCPTCGRYGNPNCSNPIHLNWTTAPADTPIPRDDARDAARYRWLRTWPDKTRQYEKGRIPWVVWLEHPLGVPTMQPVYETNLDMAIDAALHEPTPTEQPEVPR